MSRYKLKADIETITPEKAKRMLERNDNNRDLRPRLVEHYVRQILNNAWQVNGESIKIADDGTLLDGQHRLNAIVKAKKPAEFVVVRNLPKSVMPTIDIGRSRTVGDHLKMQGITDSNTTRLAGAINILTKFEGKRFLDARKRLTPTEALDYLKKNPLLMKSFKQVPKQINHLCMPSVALACHYLFHKIDKWKATEFFDRLATGEGLSKTSPILQLRATLIAVQPKKGENRKGPRMYMYYMVNAFNDFINNRRVDGNYKFHAAEAIELPSKR